MNEMMETYSHLAIVLMALGLLLMAAEAHMPSFGAVGGAGVAAFIAGAVIIYDPEADAIMGMDPGVFGGVAIAGAVFVALVAFVAARTYRRKTETGAEGLIDATADVVEWDGKQGRVRVQGEIWHAVSESPLMLSADEKVRIVKLENLTLTIRAD